MADPDRAAARDQTASERDQISSDRDQSSSDGDQTAADRDQTASDQDQLSSDEDQAASDADFEAGSDSATHDRTARARKAGTDDRATMSKVREGTGEARARAANDRDHAATLRDLAAQERDAAARLRDQQTDVDSSWQQILERAQRDRERAADDRERAADDRMQAAADRAAAARERNAALRLRSESAALLDGAATDELTGARTRVFGLDEAAHVLERTHRAGSSLVVSLVEFEHDDAPHPARASSLHALGDALQTTLRPYDLIVRYSDTNFLCVMPDITDADAATLLQRVARALAAAETSPVRFGLATADRADDLQDVIARADADLRDAQAGDGRD